MKFEKTTVKTKPTNIKNVAPAIKSPKTPQEIDEAIRLKAYELYLKRNGGAGDASKDWLTAERIILRKIF